MTVIWSCILLLCCIFAFALLLEKRNRNILWHFCQLGIICGVLLAIVNIIVQEYDAYCSIFIGVLCICYTYYDNKQNPVSKMTNAYISSLQGYVAGVGLILYGLIICP